LILFKSGLFFFNRRVFNC